MLTDLWLACSFTWWQTSRDDFKQVFSHLVGEHHWTDRICKFMLCPQWPGLPAELLNLVASRVAAENSAEALPDNLWGFPLLNWCNYWGGGSWICLLAQKALRPSIWKQEFVYLYLLCSLSVRSFYVFRWLFPNWFWSLCAWSPF